MVSGKLQFELKSASQDSDSRYVLIDALIQESPFLFLNIYSPSKTSEQCMVFANILSVLDKSDLNSSSQLIIGGDFNVHLDAEMGSGGGRVEKKDSVKNVFDLKLAYDLEDIWRISSLKCHPSSLPYPSEEGRGREGRLNSQRHNAVP